MIPLKDDNPTRRVPVLTVGLIVMNVAVFFLEVVSPAAQRDVLLWGFGLVPSRLAEQQWGWVSATLISSQFLHGGLMHLIGNMLFLWIFGNNIEDHLGRALFLPFYLGCGVAAGIVQIASNPDSGIPTIGASGAIAGVLGAYVVLFPKARVHTLIILPFFFQIVQVPAALWLGIWFAIQILSALISFGQEGGVAWFSHAGGFLFGFLVIRFTALRPKARPRYPEFSGEGWMA